MREVNERIEKIPEQAATRNSFASAPTPPASTLDMSTAEYESIRSSPVRFPIKPGHDEPEFERVFEENERYAVIENVGEAARVARHFDPRSRVKTF
jgi:hypothetical protein